MDQVLQRAQELAEAIRCSETFRAMKDAEQRMKSSEQAARMNHDYEMAYQEARRAVSGDPAGREKAIEQLHLARDRRNACPEIEEYLKAEEQFQQMMENVNRLLRLIVSETIVEDRGACSGQCSTCGGCCQ